MWPFEIGDVVEVIGDGKGYLGSFYRAKIKAKINHAHFEVEYLHLLEPRGTRKLKERIQKGRMRPIPPPRPLPILDVGNEVDCYFRDGYWTGTVTQVDENRVVYRVHFPLTGDSEDVHVNKCRPHCQWEDDVFIWPF